MISGPVPIIFLWILLFPGPAPCKRSQREMVSPGEVIHYQLRYGPFKIGQAEIFSCRDSLGKTIGIRAEAESDGIMNLFRQLHYFIESSMDPACGLPCHTVLDFQDRKNTYCNELIFDRDTRNDSALVHSKLSGSHVVSRDIYDILTAFHHFRMFEIGRDENGGEGYGAEVIIPTFHPDRLWDQKFSPAGEECLETSIGNFTCLKYHAGTVVGKYFRNPDDLTVWFIEEAPHIPVGIRMNLRIGAIVGELTDYKDL
jgi:hypothetical protein